MAEDSYSPYGDDPDIAARPRGAHIAAAALVPAALVLLIFVLTPTASPAKPRERCFGEEATMMLSPGSNVVDGTAGDDVIILRTNAFVYGRGGDDRICGSRFTDDELNGGAGADRIYSGRSPGDSLYGGPGADVLRGDPEAARGTLMRGQGGRDKLLDGDIARGGAGNDVARGDDGSGELYGGGGDDRLDGGGGGDSVQGGSGNDRLAGGPGRDDVKDSTGDDILHGDGGNDQVDASEGADQVFGDGGDDRVWDDLGIDHLDGGPGDDHFAPFADSDSDVFVGGPGRDSARYDAEWNLTGVCASLDGIANDGLGCPAAGLGDNLDPSIEDLIGSPFNDTLIGSAEANRIEGGSGDDSIDGAEGIDDCLGDEGTDSAVNCETVSSVP